MARYFNVYLGLGSNLGDRFVNIQNAINLIYTHVGNVVNISKVYKSDAYGFEGAPFLNACVCIETQLQPKTLLTTLKNIEIKLGRTSKTSTVYENRIIDIDILFIDNQTIDSKDLIVPHPEIHKRDFVLKPLSDLNPQLVHPIYHQTIKVLQLKFPKISVSEFDQSLQNPKHKYINPSLGFIAIEGNIGAGKTTLATMIAREFNAKLVLERFADNPFLPKFYKDPKRYAFTLEMSFLADRYQQIQDDLSQLDIFKQFVVSDYYVFKSLIFSKITLSEAEFNLYRTFFYTMYKEIRKPDLYVFLKQDSDTLIKNIESRGRGYEQDIEKAYLDNINKGYMEFLREHKDVKILDIPLFDRDFVKHRTDFIYILEQISAQ
jgi:deoxyguanosine kinase